MGKNMILHFESFLPGRLLIAGTLLLLGCWNLPPLTEKTDAGVDPSTPSESKYEQLPPTDADSDVDGETDTVTNSDTCPATDDDTGVPETVGVDTTSSISPTADTTTEEQQSETDAPTDTPTDTPMGTSRYPGNDSETEGDTVVPVLPAITSIDGDGSALPIHDVDNETAGVTIPHPAAHRFRTTWQVTGERLELVNDVRLSRVGGGPVFSSREGLFLHADPTGEKATIDLPEGLVPGLFSLTLESTGGDVEVSVYVLRGEKGDPGRGFECEAGACTLQDSQSLRVDGDIVAGGRLKVVDSHVGGNISTLNRPFSANRIETQSLAVGTETNLPDCPSGYHRDDTVLTYTLCKKEVSGGRFDEMVRVGNFWIDKYEISAWENRDCSGYQYGINADDPPLQIDHAIAPNGSWAIQEYACSVRDEHPSCRMTWFQAQQLCEHAGKSMCTDAMWQVAATGTPDPGTTVSLWGCRTVSAVGYRLTGLAGDEPGVAGTCVSHFGADDMIGNYAEWTSDWFVTGLDWIPGAESSVLFPWKYATDATWNANGGSMVDNITQRDGEPPAIHRGGHCGMEEMTGTYTFSAHYGPEIAADIVGTRCCIAR